MSACACLGPQFGEPLCPCMMKASGAPRSKEYEAYYAPDKVKERELELNQVLAKVYGWKTEITNGDL